MSKEKNKSKFKDNLIARGEEASKVRKIVTVIILAIVLILVIGGISGYMYIKSALQPLDSSSDEEIQVEIPLGSSTSTIANILEENGIIKNGFIFRFYIKLNNESDFQAGEYTFSPSMSIDEITGNLKTGKVMNDPLYKVTIPEGVTIDQIAEIYAEDLPITKEEFLEVVNDKEYIKELIDRFPILSDAILDDNIIAPLEGYLFAATYDFFEEKPNIKSIVETMLNQTQKVVTPYYDQIENEDMSIHEVITFASLVEEEARNEKQRKNIAGVFYNRLEEGMLLQTDPTVAYAVGEHLETTLDKHTEVDSPYNTYQIVGLPIGPISNFSESSLDAVMSPSDVDFLYFLHDSDGNIHYAETNEEHNKNREKYLK
ncbi:endolytic transglycosylase MltG [Oceanobacillus halophilus]|uniref:Endolytic murein transglycosylase n=1 Tax=Oceanobacillus halophilus TaxID=930130 RepID=A0A495AD59_9BACI|nr:endolytic transglycosylase MltG [Oceanobacillus halophilus]RKQ37868.1 endolytic transglycosylase MltG [Oceanobacillus halophilus]